MEDVDGPKESFYQMFADNKKGWVICVAGITINLIRSGLTFSFGVFIAEFRLLYQRPMAELDWMAVLVVCVTDLMTPIPTAIIRRATTKGYMICSLVGTVILTCSCIISSLMDYIPWLFLTFSFMFGFGSSLIFISSSLKINEFFPSKHRLHVFTTGAYQSAYPMAIIITSPFYAWLTAATSWRVSFQTTGALIFAFGSICSLLFLLKKNHSESVEDRSEGEVHSLEDVHNGPQMVKKCDDTDDDGLDSKWSEVFKRPERICWLFGLLLSFIVQLCLLFNLTHYTEEQGQHQHKLHSSLPVVILAILEIVTFVAVSYFLNKWKGNLVWMNIISSFIFGVIFLFWPLMDPGYKLTLILSAIFGVLMTFNNTFIYATSKEAMDMKMDIAWTSSCVFCGIGSAVSPAASGAVYDIRNSYHDVFIVQGILSLINFVVFLAIPLIKRWRKKRMSYKSLK